MCICACLEKPENLVVRTTAESFRRTRRLTMFVQYVCDFYKFLYRWNVTLLDVSCTALLDTYRSHTDIYTHIYIYIYIYIYYAAFNQRDGSLHSPIAH